MAETSKIEWTDATWNPITGCSVLSPGCKHCYAMTLAGGRLRNHPSRAGLTQLSKAGPVWTGEVRLNAQWLDQPLRWRRPRRIFVCAHGDLFHESVPDVWIDQVFAVMALAPQHTFQVLTKRAARMRAYMTSRDQARADGRGEAVARLGYRGPLECLTWPLPNVWLGVSAEDQARADERIPELLATPAAVRFVSLEPLLGPVDLTRWLHDSVCRAFDENICTCSDPREVCLDWVIVGGESGPGARPMHPDWARQIRDACAAAGVPFFFKQWGSWLPWEPDGPGVEWTSQNGRRIDRHEIGDVDDRASGWSDACLYDGEDICAHQRVGKAAAGRRLDGVTHDAMPEVGP